MPTLLPTPSREPTNKLSAQCDYRPTDPPAARLRALVGCLEDGSFAYKSLANRLNLIRNLQGPTMRKYREMYTRDLKRLKQHVTTVRATRDRRAYMLPADAQRRHVEVVFNVPYDDARPDPAAVAKSYRRTRAQCRTNVDTSAYTTYPYHTYVRGPHTKRRTRGTGASANTDADTGRTGCTGCTVHLRLAVRKGTNASQLRRKVRRYTRGVHNVRVLKYPSRAFV